MNWYNGFSSAERERKLRALHKEFPGKSHRYYQPPCHVCGDPVCEVAPHSEDYSWPPIWERPAMFAICRPCHNRVHTRFNSPFSWDAYRRHLQRGGYGSDLKRYPAEGRRVTRLAKLLAEGKDLELAPLNGGRQVESWWETLTVDPGSKTGRGDLGNDPLPSQRL